MEFRINLLAETRISAENLEDARQKVKDGLDEYVQIEPWGDHIIEIADGIVFDSKWRCFLMSEELSQLIYDSDCIASYSGVNEWCHHMMCELMDLYNGSSEYNHMLGTYSMEKEFASHGDACVKFVEKYHNDPWMVKAAKMVAEIVKNTATGVK